ncbi:MAG: hypothetical protein WCA44_18465 [Acidobacteriaceae bacterium]
MNREAIFEALFALVRGLPLFVTTSRRARLAKDVSADEQPALFLEETPGEVVKYQSEVMPPKFYLYADLGFYARIPEDLTTPPGSVLNPLLDAVCAALAPGPSQERQTLGGLVYNCRINGKILKEEGLLDGQAAVVVPLEIEVFL